MKAKEKDELLAARIPGILHYHQKMLADGVRNKLLYQAIKKHVTSETKFLDIGAGTGVWAILAALLGAKKVVAVEIEECLIPIIYQHAKENGVADKIEIIQADADDVRIRGKFDVIVSELFGSDAFGEKTVNSFVNLRKRYLAKDGVLIPQKLSMMAAPAYVGNLDQEIPAGLPVKSDFLKFLSLNIAQSASIEMRPRIEFLAEPQKLAEMDFRTIEEPPPIKNLSGIWRLDDLSKANAFTVFHSSVFTDEIIMDSFGSQSWGATNFYFEPFAEASGEIKFDLNLDGTNGSWSISLPEHSLIKARSFSSVFAFARIRMAQQMTPHRKFKEKPEKK